MLNLDNSPQTRRNFVGASDAPAIMGVSPWKTAYQLWEEKVGIRESNFTSKAMQRGIDMEEEARMSFEEQTGIFVFPQRIVNEHHSWMVATLDGMDLKGENVVEIKCPGKIDHTCAMDGVIPEKYIPQLMHQMIVACVTSIYYFSYSPSSSKILQLEYDPAYSKVLLDKEIQFWNNVQEFTPPTLSDKDYNLKEDELWNQAAQEWLHINSQLDSLKKKEEELRNTLVAMSGKSNSMGCGIKISRILRKGNVEYKNIPELKDVDLDKYRKGPIEIWRIGKC